MRWWNIPLFTFWVFRCLEDELASEEWSFCALDFIRQKNDRLAPGHKRGNPWGILSVFTGSIAGFSRKRLEHSPIETLNGLLLASIKRSLGLKSEDDSCSLTLATSLGCKMSNQLWPSRSPYFRWNALLNLHSRPYKEELLVNNWVLATRILRRTISSPGRSQQRTKTHLRTE